MDLLLERLRSIDLLRQAGGLANESGRDFLTEFARSGVKFAASGGTLENAYYSAVYKLPDCLSRESNGSLTLQEGGVYKGCWLESTGTINAELLSRFVPSVSRATYEQFADHQREDGLIPYKIAEDQPVFRQIQLVSPPARSIWNYYLSNGKDRGFLEKMYAALNRYDEWLEKYRNTRGTGCVEAFCAFDTGHDLSPRFWHVADTPHRGDPTQVDPDSPLAPYLAPDLTASVYCSRKYLALMARELGLDAPWEERAEQSLRALFRHCYDGSDGFFYDRDKHDRFVRLQSDVLLRVLACEVGDSSLFASSLSRYLLNTRKFFAKYPFTSIAMDDPRFDPHSAYNTWAGATNFLSLIRAPHAFEHHGRHVELTWAMLPILSALSRMTRFGQVLSPWTGEEGYTESYSPALLCMLDFVERLCGILPAPDGEVWFTGLLPYPLDHGISLAERTAYARTIDGIAYELLNSTEECTILADGRELARFPYGVRIVTDRAGQLRAIVGMTLRPVRGRLLWNGQEYAFRVEGNERLGFRGNEAGFVPESNPGVVIPAYE